jgi:nucleoside-diphosphate-sugar epimerase
MKILVTGGAGFIGSHLVEKLVENKYNVFVVDDLSNGSLKNLSNVKNKITFLKEDISKYNCFDDISDIKFSLIYALACHPRSLSFDYPFRDVQVNVQGMINVLEFAKKHKTRVIFSSNSGIYDTTNIPIYESTLDNPTSPYDVNKLAGEYYCKIYNYLYNIPYVIFRFATVYGPRQKVTDNWKPVVLTFIEECLRREESEIHGDGQQTRDFIYVDDIVDALLKGGIVKGVALNTTMILGTGVETDIGNLYHNITLATGASINFKQTPALLGDIKRMCYPSYKAQLLLGWNPKTSLDEGIRKTIRWYLENNKI